jgi:hypothetical protein
MKRSGKLRFSVNLMRFQHFPTSHGYELNGFPRRPNKSISSGSQDHASGPNAKQPRSRFLCLKILRLEAVDSSLLTTESPLAGGRRDSPCLYKGRLSFGLVRPAQTPVAIIDTLKISTAGNRRACRQVQFALWKGREPNRCRGFQDKKQRNQSGNRHHRRAVTRRRVRVQPASPDLQSGQRDATS